MDDTSTFWQAVAPYLSYIEGNFLNLEAIRKLTASITDPVLVVGAGQGLLVEELVKKGHRVDGLERSAEMVEYAQKRRGLKLVQADAASMPFDDNSYSTSIIATGVVDLMDDEHLVKQIVDETRRVTADTGQVLVAFYGIDPAMEEFLKTLGLIADGRLHQRRLFQLGRLKPTAFVGAVRREARLGLFAALRALLRVRVGLPKATKRATRMWTRLWREAEDPDLIINSMVEVIPFRTEPDIRDLFRRFGVPIKDVQVFDTCTVAQL